MKKIGNLTELADILGHSSLETIRIYTMGTDEEKRSSLAVLGL
jgi:integrase/recombinase XerD